MKITYLCQYCGKKESFDFYYWETDFAEKCGKCGTVMSKDNILDSDPFGYERAPETKIVIKRDVFGYDYKKKK